MILFLLFKKQTMDKHRQEIQSKELIHQG
jgi:hypothetical protein